MTTWRLVISDWNYLTKVLKRLKILSVLLDEGAYSDVVREAQEIVELALKCALAPVLPRAPAPLHLSAV
jgi:HEPN domain-containing protein